MLQRLRYPRHGITASVPRRNLYQSILETIGNTPIVKVNNLSPEADAKGISLYAKCEFFNPLSSVKDRLGFGIIEDAERSGKLKPGQTVVEATSGNTGISLAMVCAQKGYPCVLVMTETFSIERRKIMRALGAKVVLTPAAEKGMGMVKKAAALAEKHGWFLAHQFENDANAAFHEKTTGPEIVHDFRSAGIPLDYWVLGYGTGGTFQGAGKVIKREFPNCKIVLSEPENAALIKSGHKQERNANGAPKVSHAAFTPHPIQGWTPDFIPLVAQKGLDLGLHDKLVTVSGERSIQVSRALSSKEGIFTGISGGASMASALDLIEEAPEGSNILAMLADTAERYMSTPLFADIIPEMNETEQEICNSV